MVVAYLDVVGISINEAEADTPLIIHRDGILPFPLILERMKPIAWRHPEIIELGRKVHIFQFTDSSFGNVRRKAPGSPCSEQIVGPPIRERLDHATYCIASRDAWQAPKHKPERKKAITPLMIRCRAVRAEMVSIGHADSGRAKSATISRHRSNDYDMVP